MTTSPTETKPKRPVPAWSVVLPGNRVLVARGHTKGEARADAKRQAGIPPAGRLPAGARLDRVEGFA